MNNTPNKVDYELLKEAILGEIKTSITSESGRLFVKMTHLPPEGKGRSGIAFQLDPALFATGVWVKGILKHQKDCLKTLFTHLYCKAYYKKYGVHADQIPTDIVLPGFLPDLTQED